MTGLAHWLVAALAGGGGALALLQARRRLVLRRDELEREVAEARVRAVALAFVEGLLPHPSLGPSDTRAFGRVLVRYGRLIKGPARARIAAFLESSGEVDRRIRALRSRRSRRRAAAAHALGDMFAPAAVPPLLRALADPCRDVRTVAARSLGKLGAVDAIAPLADGLVLRTIPRAVAGQALLEIGPASLPALRRLVVAGADEDRACAIELVGLLGDASDTATLATGLPSKSADVRARAARSLGRIGARDAAARLRLVLYDRFPDVRAAAASALGAIGDVKAAEELVGMASEDVFECAQAALQALARIGPRSSHTHVSEAA